MKKETMSKEAMKKKVDASRAAANKVVAKGLKAANKAVAQSLGKNGKVKKPTVKKAPKEKKLKVYKKSAVLERILKENPDMVESVHDHRNVKQGYRVNLLPSWQYPTDKKEPQHFLQEEGLVTMLTSIRNIEPCYCDKCQKGITWKRPTAYTRETKLRCKTDGGYIIMTTKQWDDRPLEYVKVGQIPNENSLRWVDHNKEDALKINKLLGEKVFAE